MNEWEFTGEVKSWIDQIVQRNSNLPFSGASIETKGSGSQERRDLSRPMGNEGNWSTMVVDVNMMLVPCAIKINTSVQGKLIAAFGKLCSRDSKQFLTEQRMRTMTFEKAGRSLELEQLSDLCELDMPDRRELDHAVLELLGIKSKKERGEWIDKLYAYLREFFEETRRKEELAIVNRNVTKRKGNTGTADGLFVLRARLWKRLYKDTNAPLLIFPLHGHPPLNGSVSFPVAKLRHWQPSVDGTLRDPSRSTLMQRFP